MATSDTYRNLWSPTKISSTIKRLGISPLMNVTARESERLLNRHSNPTVCCSIDEAPMYTGALTTPSNGGTERINRGEFCRLIMGYCSPRVVSQWAAASAEVALIIRETCLASLAAQMHQLCAGT